MVGIVSRLVAQKGFDLLFGPLTETLAARDFRLAIVGTGEERFEKYFSGLARAFRDRVGYYAGYSEDLAHLIEAGSDMFLMPSRYEPCGLNQMYSLKYGTVPIVRRTGGLADTVQLFDPDTDSGTGFVFDHSTPQGVSWALNTALDIFADRPAWQRLMLRGMAMDFSWERQGEEYLRLYDAMKSM